SVGGGYVPSMGLGAIAITPLDLATAYATIAAGGVYSRPLAIRRVVLPNGRVDDQTQWGTPQRKRVISDGVAYEVTKILQQNVLHGTGVGAYFGRPAAGKTGTTDNHADAWFCGYTPNLDTTVWVGYPRAEIPMTDVHGIAVAGGTFPATIWRLFMQAALWHAHPLEFPQPRHYPAYGSWNGQYAFAGGGYDSSAAPQYTPPAAGTSTTLSGSTQAPSTRARRPAPPPPTTAPPPTAPPPTTAPPPPEGPP